MNLSEINSPADIKGLDSREVENLAGEIREAIIRTVALNGGHLASNLGAVELTVALHRTFDCPRDKIIFDVGHQCYAHKILTGRYNQFSTLRKTDGLCGFPRREESPYDAYGTGHASTAISAALGMARARDIKGEKYSVVAVVGDGAMTGGMCYEALNDAGSSKTPMIVVLNDNEMSISRNVGALSRQLTRLRLSRGWLGIKKSVGDTLNRLPVIGKPMHRVFQRIKNELRNVLVKDRFFTSLGFQYLGPIDGHDIRSMEKIFRRCQDIGKPVLVHIVTKKGFGFAQAEEKPEKYHGVSPFETEDGKTRGEEGPSMGKTAGEYLAELAEKRHDLCAVTAAMTQSAGFSSFAVRFPDRLFDVGIAEEHAAVLAAGLAAGGMRPFVAIYETFLQRAYDQIVEDICLQRLPVCLLMDRAGLGAEDGPTHHGVFGVSMLRHIPGIRIFSPRCAEECKSMIDWVLTRDVPAAIRYPRRIPELGIPYRGPFEGGRWEMLREGKDAALLAASSILEECLEAAELLKQKGIEAAVVNASSLRPLDENMLQGLVGRVIPLITVEEHVLSGGFGSAVNEWCAHAHAAAPAAMLALPDEFIPHGSRNQLIKRYGLDRKGIAERTAKAVET